MKKIFWIGDSTVQTNQYPSYPCTGIGQVFPLFLRPGYTVENHGKNGRSTKSFLSEGLFEPVKIQMGKGDFLFIQFGHNDEKIADPERYTKPYGEYTENLRLFIREARAREACPVLITPLERRCFVSEHALKTSAHQEYVEAARMLAREEQVAMADLFERSREALQQAGEQASRKWYMFFPAGLYENYPEGMEDNTHPSHEGAVYFGRVISKELCRLGYVYADIVLECLRG